MTRTHNLFITGIVAVLIGAGALVACSKGQEPSAATDNKDQAAAMADKTTADKSAAAATKNTAAAGAAKPASGAAAQGLPADKRDIIFKSPVNTLDGDPSSLGAHTGKALLVVNVASKCGLTPQYEDLEKLQKKYADKGFSVVGFPCNQFGGQEPGTAEEIKTFCSANYGITFPMFEKIEVNGDKRHPIYAALTEIPDTKGKAGDVQWNFEKFVISADRTKVTRFRPRTEPMDPAVIAAIEAGLPSK